MRLKRGASGLNGIILIDKPAGMTSHDVVDVIRGLSSERRVGHAGTLDPAATGLLVVMVGAATKMSDCLTAAQKTYRATIVFGIQTDTDDSDGVPLRQGAVDPAIFADGYAQTVLDGLIGPSTQRPPAFSAIKVDGVTGYQAARKGSPLDLEPRDVEVFDATLVSIDARQHAWTVDLTVSKGTYIRALARDLGAQLGTCAHLGALRRTACGELRVEQAYTLDFLRQQVARPFDLARYFIESDYGGPSPVDAQVVIGVFDGLHLGHQSLIDGAAQAARAQGTEAVMVTFDRLPSEVLTTTKTTAQLYPLIERDRLAIERGIDRIITLPFTRELAALTPTQFIERELMTRVIPAQVWVGKDFRFGSAAQADADTLKDLGVAYGFATRIQELTADGSEKISATAIRDALKDGQVEHAARLLGRPYTIQGTVTSSRGIGRRHGFPTANISDVRLFDHIGDGVYQGHVTLDDGTVFEAALFIGVPSNSTDGRRVLEAHLLDYEGDLTDATVTIAFDTRLRDVERVGTDDEIFRIVGAIVSDI